MPDPLDFSVPNASKGIVDSISPATANYESEDRTVRGLTKIPGLSETILPSIKALLMPGKDNPYGALIDKSTNANVSAAQTDAMRRGLTGSDIEAGSMAGARAAGEDQKTSFYTQNASQMSGLVKDIMSGDISNQRENLMMLAQLMGQKITSDQDLQLFHEQLSANMGMADKANKTALYAAAISGTGAAIGSDRRLKLDIKKIDEAGGLDIVKFRWTKRAQDSLVPGSHSGDHVGVIAQDVEKIYPHAVGQREWYKTVDFSKMPLAVILAIAKHEGA